MALLWLALSPPVGSPASCSVMKILSGERARRVLPTVGPLRFCRDPPSAGSRMGERARFRERWPLSERKRSGDSCLIERSSFSFVAPAARGRVLESGSLCEVLSLGGGAVPAPFLGLRCSPVVLGRCAKRSSSSSPTSRKLSALPARGLRGPDTSKKFSPSSGSSSSWSEGRGVARVASPGP